MKKNIFLFLSLLLAGSIAFAQKNNDPVIFEINGKNIKKSEFMRDFLRSVGKDPAAAPTACTYEKRQALEEYVQLFVNYRTKLEDAYAQGFDTIPSLKKELAGYRKELAAPYLIDSTSLKKILAEAYERNHYVLSAAHIFVRIPFNPKPADTLKAYNKSLNYYNRVSNGEDFFTLARESAAELARSQGYEPDDPRAKDDGRLGNFTVFDMVYPFENAVYSLNVGEVSKPVRSQYGYHVIKLLGKVPYFGKTTFQHIWISEKKDSLTTERMAREAYKLINEGSPFNTVCRNYSDDNSSSQNGGLLTDMSIRQIPPEYVETLASLQPEQVSQPFKTRYGWHILKLIRRDSLPSFDEMTPYYKQRLNQDSRSNIPREVFIEQSKQRYDFIDYTQMLQRAPKGKKGLPVASLDQCIAAINDTVFYNDWHFKDSMVTDHRALFRIGDKSYNSVDLLKYVEAHQRAEAKKDKKEYILNRYNSLISDKVFEYASSQLEKEYKEFDDLMTEYRNGLIIFSYNDANIWSKAIRDSAGLAKFYAENVAKHSIDNENDASYFVGECVDLKIFTVADSSLLKPDKAVKIVTKGKKNGTANADVTKKLNKALKADSVKVTYEARFVETDRQTLLSKNQLRQGVYVIPSGHGYQVVRVDAIANPRPKTLTEARGYYINDYQSFLEQQLINDLRKKYNVVIHQDVIDEITY